ncbi:MAG TPA: SpoIIE family protein phosphatase [Leptospiraceae bacterium]|nr:SpoIIE family protein phosphatase [Leptospiraceae bacterium]HNF25194.1 SpoIIE family protein phosphatase [Leptospiraceae bacterium]HNI97029.1 SpoIIE family protein phosphatase [Leptospiraceae bacterium]HNN02824.1 SpoIIE family protein phosphatase [Leptospiraceae bacterium]HNO23213.1 SpoIIE family protein phosphatase [Leptospiraceae bacterium]
MSADSLQSLLKKGKGATAYFPRLEKLEDNLSLILSEIANLVGAQNEVLYLLDSEGTLKDAIVGSNTEETRFLAELGLRERKGRLVKKKEVLEGREIAESHIVCFLGDPDGFLDVGVIVLSGLNHFENFSISDFELAEVYSKTLVLLFCESSYAAEQEEIYLRFSSSLLLLLHSTENYQKNNRLEYLLQEIIRVSGLINSPKNLKALLLEVMESVKTVFRTESCSILLVDKAKNELYFHIVAGEKEEEISKIRVPMGKGIAGTVAVTREPMIINDAQNDDRVYKVVDKASAFVTRNIIATPLVANDEVIGVMEAINTIDRNNFNASDISLFLSFSGAAALAIQKTRLLEDLEITNLNLEKRVSELAGLFELGLAVAESQTVTDLLKKSLHIIARELKSDITAIFLEDPAKRFIECIALRNSRLENSRLISDSQSLIVKSIAENRLINESSAVLKSGVDREFLSGAFLILPINDGAGKPFGAISITSHTMKTHYDQAMIRLLLTISSQMMKGYENIKLNENMLAKKAMEKEIEITRNIQTNILPGKLPTGSNFEIGVKSVPAKEVSGDFYDFHKYDDGQFSFLIADVSGKSLPAAIFMAMSSSIIRTLSRAGNVPPSDLLKEANTLIYEDSQSGMFVTLFYIHYDPADYEISFASAGHNDQIWIKNDGTYELVKGSGAPLGVVPAMKYTGGKFTPANGDLIVLYTDGAVEEKNRAEEEYGLDRFVSEIIKRKDKHPSQIIEEVYQDIKNFSEGQDQFDDFTVLILKINNDFQFRKSFPAANIQIPKLRDFIESVLVTRITAETVIEDILLCCDEAATNIIMHSYKDSPTKNPTFECGIKFEDRKVIIILRDKGTKFDRSAVPKPSLEANLKGERKGGFGVYLVETLMSRVEYRYTEGYNETIMEKDLI